MLQDTDHILIMITGRYWNNVPAQRQVDIQKDIKKVLMMNLVILNLSDIMKKSYCRSSLKKDKFGQ